MSIKNRFVSALTAVGMCFAAFSGITPKSFNELILIPKTTIDKLAA